MILSEIDKHYSDIIAVWEWEIFYLLTKYLRRQNHIILTSCASIRRQFDVGLTRMMSIWCRTLIVVSRIFEQVCDTLSKSWCPGFMYMLNKSRRENWSSSDLFYLTPRLFISFTLSQGKTKSEVLKTCSDNLLIGYNYSLQALTLCI